jgi:dolichol-phosphate mannosyltransferase
MRVTVVIPALNEAGNIGRLVEETYASGPPSRLAEVIVVDDASTDATGAEIKALIESGNYSGYLRHDRSSGQSAAMRSGILAAASPIIATMDGDGQSDPHDIQCLLEVLAAPGTAGPALVGGVRTERKATGSKRWASCAANWVRDKVLQNDCPDTCCGIKVYWREVFLRLPFFTSMHRYLPAQFQTYGHEVAYVPVNDRLRQAGVCKYNNLNRSLVGIYDLVGVIWLRKRTKVPAIVERHPEAQVHYLGARLKPVNDGGARLSASDKS